MPMAGAVLNALNYRLDARIIAFILAHGEAKVLITDREFSATIEAALAAARPASRSSSTSTIRFTRAARCWARWTTSASRRGRSALRPGTPGDEWNAISLNYTSGTTGDPKGVVYHHRGAFLNALGNALALGLSPPVYLWTLPMFHCNGWCFTWAVTAAPDPCLPAARRAGAIFAAIDEQRVTHLCGAPIVLNMLANAPDGRKRHFDHTVEVVTGGAAPPSADHRAWSGWAFASPMSTG